MTTAVYNRVKIEKCCAAKSVCERASFVRNEGSDDQPFSCVRVFCERVVSVCDDADTDVYGRTIFKIILTFPAKISVFGRKHSRKSCSRFPFHSNSAKNRKSWAKIFLTRSSRILCGDGGIFFSADFSHQQFTTAPWTLNVTIL